MIKFLIIVNGETVNENYVEADRESDAWDFMMWVFDPFNNGPFEK